MMTPERTESKTLRICVIGPECTGKTTLSAALAEKLGTTWVPEYARGYLNKLNRPYTEADLLKIAHGQLRMEDEWQQDAKGILVCDTNLLVIKVWSEHKFGVCDEEIIRHHQQRQYHHYLLTQTDVPWEDDPQREHPQLRDHFADIYARLVEASGVPFTRIHGSAQQRLELALQAAGQLRS